MSMIGDTRDTGLCTLVGFHDLLGFGELLAASGGTLDSAVGELAYRRILELRASLMDIQNAFPKPTMFFHFNDTVTAYLDLNVKIGASHTDPAGIATMPLKRAECIKVLQFVSACATLHQRSIAREEDERLGPAGRTFVVMGKRWDLHRAKSSRIFEVPPLQANLAFAEAYIADRAGSRAGFSHRTYYRMYLNDHVWQILSTTKLSLSQEEWTKLNTLGFQGRDFPENLCSPDTLPIAVDIFHRTRNFRSVMSHHACDIAKVLA
jgi:hypothetical protein